MSNNATPQEPLEPAAKSNRLRYIGIAFGVVLFLALGFQFLDEEMASRVYDPVRVGIGHLSSLSVSSGAGTLLDQLKTFSGVDKLLGVEDDYDYSDMNEKLQAHDQQDEHIKEQESDPSLRAPALNELPSLFNVLLPDNGAGIGVVSSSGPTLFAMAMSSGQSAGAEPVESIEIVENVEEKLDPGVRRRRVLAQPGRKYLEVL